MWFNVFPPAVTIMMDQGISLHPGPEEPTVLHGQVRLKFLNALVRARTRLQRGVTQTFAVFSVVFLLLWISAFLYGSLYYSYMPNVAFSTTVHYYHRYACKLTCTSKTNITNSAVSLSAGQAVSHLHLSCALIHWPMCLWQGTGSMYVCNVCGSCRVYTNMQLINDSCHQNGCSGADIRASLSDLSAAGNARFSCQSGTGDVHDPDNVLLPGWRPGSLLSSTCMSDGYLLSSCDMQS